MTDAEKAVRLLMAEAARKLSKDTQDTGYSAVRCAREYQEVFSALRRVAAILGLREDAEVKP